MADQEFLRKGDLEIRDLALTLLLKQCYHYLTFYPILGQTAAMRGSPYEYSTVGNGEFAGGVRDVPFIKSVERTKD